MHGRMFDDLTRAAAGATTRRRALGLLAGSGLAAGLARFDLAAAKKGKKKKRCKKLFQGCGGKKKCCKGLLCVDGSCGCPAGTVPSGGKCSNPDPQECDNDNDCGANEICQNGKCVPEPPECDNDNDCGNDEICDDGECVPAPPECVNDNDCGNFEVCENGECVFEPQCELDNDCPPNSVCIGGICFALP